MHTLRKRERQRCILSTPQCLQQPGLSWAKAKGQDADPGFPCGWQGLKYLGFDLLLPKVRISRMLESNRVLVPRHSNMG